jgi:3-oxoacyl-[acyl-carrier protein] reductase
VRLEGRVALVTGAASGIGAATALRFAREGALLALTDVARDALERVAADAGAAGAKVAAMQGDVSRKADVERVVAQATEAFGRVDVLVNNAGITRDGMATKLTEEQWDAVLDVNLKGTFLCAQAVLPGMRERGWGRIVNTASVSALGNIGQSNYSASKAGVIGLTRTLALEAAKYGITVNCVAPGAIATPMLATIPEPIKEGLIGTIPLRRMAQPEEVAALHVFLASDEAGFITGQTIFIDGGMSVGV